MNEIRSTSTFLGWIGYLLEIQITGGLRRGITVLRIHQRLQGASEAQTHQPSYSTVRSGTAPCACVLIPHQDVPCSIPRYKDLREIPFKDWMAKMTCDWFACQMRGDDDLKGWWLKRILYYFRTGYSISHTLLPPYCVLVNSFNPFLIVAFHFTALKPYQHNVDEFRCTVFYRDPLLVPPSSLNVHPPTHPSAYICMYIQIYINGCLYTQCYSS